ncbi:dihydroxyacetone kinase, partial [Streptomyces yangpuensis]
MSTPRTISLYRVGWASSRGGGRAAGAPGAGVALVPGEGLAGLCAEAGATTVLVRPGEVPATAEL